MIPVAVLVSAIVFVLLRITPGDPVLVYAGEERDPVALEALRHEYGLDQPLPLQYVVWVEHAIRGDLGRSLRTRQPVTQAVLERLPKTLGLGVAALVISVGIALVVGTLAALRRNSPLDLIATGFTIAGVSLPNFYLGIILILVFSLAFRLLPPGGYADFVTDPVENLKRLILPAITRATASLPINLRQGRSSLLDVFGHDYMRNARAKGLHERTIIARHALKNALIPVVTLIGIQIGAIIEGAFITETIFLWPGIGRL